MPEYIIHVTSTYKVEADSPEEAKQIMEDGDGPPHHHFEDVWISSVYLGDECVWDLVTECRKKYNLFR